MRSQGVMWMLGAGASRSAGIKTAWDMIWDFKQTLYRSHKKLPPSSITDPGDPIVQRKLQKYFDDLGTFPANGDNDEYAKFFEETFPNAKDRRAYLDGLIKVGKPSYGHLAIALLLKEEACKIIWTTNFDKVIEDAASKLFGTTSRLVVADLGEPTKLTKAYAEGRFPIYGKLHGDYHSEELKNTNDELRLQDDEMRKAFIQACQTNGLAVVGYSGRDDSILDSLRESLNEGRGFPQGLFWFKRSGEELFPAATELIEEAQGMGVEAYIIENETFDELMSDIVRFLPQTENKLGAIEGAKPPRLSSSPLRRPSKFTPTIRTNALPIISHPVMCRFVDCEIGGWKEIKDAIDNAGVDILAQRISEGVIAFGRDKDIRATFEPFGIKTFDTRSIPNKRLIRESGDRSLIRECLLRALNKRPDIEIVRRGRRLLALPNASTVRPQVFHDGDSRPVDVIRGQVGSTGITWTECCELRIDYRLDRLWLLLDPKIYRDIPENTPEEKIELSKEFVRRRLTARFNPSANSVLNGWVRLLVGDDREITLSSFDISDGIDAVFEISAVTGFSGVDR